jgi:glycerol-3-phosphate acyltransferase PlsY
MIVATAAAVLLSYVMGSIPTGFWLGLWLRGVDIRRHGSKNIGATNTLRVLGKPLGAAALVGDMAKGAIPVVFIAPLSEWNYAPIACGLAAICGHTFSLFLRFRGGKGVATSAGVFLGLAPLPTMIAAAVFAAVVAATRMVSAGSILGSVAIAIAVFVFPTDNAVRAIAVAIALLVIVRHRDNIRRIRAGTENRLGGAKPSGPTSTD